MIKIKNVRPGILIIADAGLKLTPGESTEVETTTRQIEKAITDGFLARIDAEPETKPKAKAAARNTESKGESKKPATPPAKPEQSESSEESPEGQSADAGQGQLIEAGNGSS